MNFKLKRVKNILWVNRKLSDFFFRWIRILNYRKETQTVTFLKAPFSFMVNLDNYSIDRKTYWKDFKTLKADPLFYIEVDKAIILSKGIVLNKKKEVLLESTIFQIEYLNILCSNHIIKFQKLLPSTNENLVFSLLNKLDNNYFHWTIESLTRVLLVNDLPFFRNYKIAIKSDSLPFIKESLQFLFKIKDNQFIEKPIYKKIKTKKTLVVSFPHLRNKSSQNTNVYYPFIINQLNQLAHNRLLEINIAISNSKNIIISRKNALERRIINEKSFEKSLSKYDFKIIYLETLTYIEQVILFANAKIIIATHGAGITNIIYSKKALLIELFPSKRNIRDAYYFTQITSALEMEHHTLLYQEENNKQDFFIIESLINKIKGIIKSKVNSTK